MRVRRTLTLISAVLFFIAAPVFIYLHVLPCVTVVSDIAQKRVMPKEEWGELWSDLLVRGFRLNVVFPDPVVFCTPESTSEYLARFSDSKTVVLMHSAASAIHKNKTDIRAIYPETGVCAFCPGWDDFDVCLEDRPISGWKQAAEKLYSTVPVAAVVYTPELEEEAQKLSEILENDGVFMYRLEKNTRVYIQSVAQNIASKNCSCVFCLNVPELGILMSALGDIHAVTDWRYSRCVDSKMLQGIVAPSLSGAIVPFAGIEREKLRIIGKVDAEYEYIPRRVF